MNIAVMKIQEGEVSTNSPGHIEEAASRAWRFPNFDKLSGHRW